MTIHAQIGNLSKLLVVIVAVLIVKPPTAISQTDGKTLYKNVCGACHTIGSGKLIGPDLFDVHKRRSEKWIKSFIKSSQTMINNGDSDAVALYEEYNKLVMPDSFYSESQIQLVLDYIKDKSSEKDPNSAPKAASSSSSDPGKETKAAETTSKEDIVYGQNLFQGTARLSHGGASCISCHDVKNDAVIGGGILAKELTTVFSQMGEAGVKAILAQSPFPVMEQAYRDKPLTDKEIHGLVAFLRDSDENHTYQQPRSYGAKFAASGIFGVMLLFGVYAFIGLRRKKRAVNHEIFERQLRSD